MFNPFFFFEIFGSEFLLTIGIISMLIYNSYIVRYAGLNFPKAEDFSFIQCFVILFFTLYYAIESYSGSFYSFELGIGSDLGIYYLRISILVFSILILLLMRVSIKITKIHFFEFYVIYLLVVFSFLCLTLCKSLIGIFLMLEMQSLLFYVLASLKRDSALSVEAGLSYFISGSFITGIFLFGCSCIYFSIGDINLFSIKLLNSILEYSVFAGALLPYNLFIFKIGGVLLICTFLFKIGIAPFHLWLVKVYELSPNFATIIFSTISKLPLFFIFVLVLNSVKSLLGISIVNDLLFYLGALTVAVSTFEGLFEYKVKRLLILSSIAQSGFMLIGSSTCSLAGVSSTIYFTFIYILTSIIAWGVVLVFYSSLDNISTISKKYVETRSMYVNDLSNLYVNGQALIIIVMSLALFSYAGVPPFAGFLAKLEILRALVSDSQEIFAAILIILSCFSAFYYIRLIKVACFEPVNNNTYTKRKDTFGVILNSNKDIIFLIMFCCVLLFLMFIYSSVILVICDQIAISVLNFSLIV